MTWVSRSCGRHQPRYAVVAGGGVMLMQQAAKHAAVEMDRQALGDW